jgi:hypothetical protein
MSEQQGRPIYNLSSRVLSLAQYLDMLAPGDYSVRLVKPDLAGLSWSVEITRVERIREMELPVRVVTTGQP